MFGRFVGSAVAATFGLVFVLVNSGGLPDVARIAVQALGVGAFAAFLITGFSQSRVIFGGAYEENRRPFGGQYWTIVAIEVIALFGGLLVLDRVFNLGQYGVVWVAIVVGLHFLPMAKVTGHRFFSVLTVLVTAAGVAGAILAFASAPLWVVEAVAGVGSGFILLGSAWWGMAQILAAGRGAAAEVNGGGAATAATNASDSANSVNFAAAL